MPGQWNTVVNSGALWVVPVFAAGALFASSRRAAPVGLAMMLATVLGYFVTAMLSGAPVTVFPVSVWCVVALVAGPLYGLAGAWWRRDERRLRVVGIALLGSVFLAEGAFLVLVNGYWGSGLTLIGIGVISAVLMSRPHDRALALLALPVPAVAAGGVYLVVNWVFSQRAL